MRGIQGKITVVTGGTRGIGKGIAKRFLEEGATVIIIGGKNKEDADKTIAELSPLGQIEAMMVDLSDAAAVEKMIDDVVAKYGRIDILVNNAGVSESTPFGAYTGELFDRVMDLNVKGMFHCARGAVPWMERQGRGVILNTSSMVSFYGQPAGVAYPVSKFAVNGFTLSLARELAPKGIRVNAVAPGIIETDMMKAVPKEVIEPMIARILSLIHI